MKTSERKTLGLVLFALGVVALVCVFAFGYHIYANEIVNITDNMAQDEIVTAVTKWAANFFVRIISLAVMLFIGVFMTDKGIYMMFENKK